MSKSINHDHLLAKAMVDVLNEHGIAAKMELVTPAKLTHARPRILDDKSRFIYNLLGGNDYFWEKYMSKYRAYHKEASNRRKSKSRKSKL
jgi:hypothetical protein